MCHIWGSLTRWNLSKIINCAKLWFCLRTASLEAAQLTGGVRGKLLAGVSQVQADRFGHHGKVGEALLGGQEVSVSHSQQTTFSVTDHVDTVLC